MTESPEPDEAERAALIAAANEAARQERIASVMRELEALEASASLGANLAPSGRRGSQGAAGPSAVFSVRLDRDELEALESRALVLGIKPSVFARNLIRLGLAQPGNRDASAVLDRLESAVDELRALVA
jgi:hypothetical protein